MGFPQAKLSAIAALLLLGGAAACTNRDVTTQPHAGPVMVDEIVVAPVGPAADPAALAKLDINAQLSGLRADSSAQEKIKILTELEPFVLNRNYVEDKQLTTSEKMAKALSAFMLALVGDGKQKGLAQLDPKAAAPWIEKTRVVIDSGCDGLGHGCSPAIRRFFRGEIGSAVVLELSALELGAAIEAESGKTAESKLRRREMVNTYYRRLKTALELRRSEKNSDLEFLYLKHAAEYAEAFRSAEPTTRGRRLLEQHVDVFEAILNDFKPDLKDPSRRRQFETFVNNFAPWRYSSKTGNPFGRASRRMLSLAAQNFLYVAKDAETGLSLSPSLLEAIKESQAIPQTPDANSKSQPVFEAEQFKSLDAPFALTAKHIETVHPTIWRDLVLNSAFKRDEYFFIVDRLFGDHLSADEASEIWRGTKLDSETLLKVAEQYAKIQMAAQIVRTNAFMAKIYSSPTSAPSMLLEQAPRDSAPLANQWNQLIGRLTRINTFLEQNLKSTENIWGKSEFTNLNRKLTAENLGRNAKFISVYPNMMLMAYYLAESKAKIPVSTDYGIYEIETGEIIPWFFNGTLRALFNFGNNEEPLKRIETLYAFLFALKTDTFAAFSSYSGGAIDIPKFFEVVVGKFLDSDRLVVQEQLDKLRRDLRQNTMSVFEKTCTQDAALRKTNMVGKQGLELSLQFHQFQYGTYLGSMYSGGYSYEAMKFTDGQADALTKLNTELDSKLSFIETLVRLFEKHSESMGMPSEKLKTVGAQIRSFTGAVETMRSEYLTELVRWNRKLTTCIDQSIEIEIDRQDALLALEERHLRAVWKVLSEAHKSSNRQEALLKILNTKIAESTNPKAVVASRPFVPRSRATLASYTYDPLDVMLRMVQHLKVVAPNVKITFPSDLVDNSLWAGQEPRVIPFTLNEEEFVRLGMSNFNEKQTSIVRWIDTTSDPSPFISRMKLLTELYKLGPVKLLNTDHPSCKFEADISKCPLADEAQPLVTAQDLVKQMTGILGILSMTKDGKPKADTRMIDLVGSTYRWQKLKLVNFTLDSNGDPITLFENLHLMLTGDTKLLSEALEFHKMANSLADDFLFSPEDRYKDVVAESFFPRVRRHFGRGDALIDAIKAKEIEDSMSKRLLEYTYEITPRGFAHAERKVGADGIPIYLSRSKIGDFNTSRTVFDRDTSGRFK